MHPIFDNLCYSYTVPVTFSYFCIGSIRTLLRFFLSVHGMDLKMYCMCAIEFSLGEQRLAKQYFTIYYSLTFNNCFILLGVLSLLAVCISFLFSTWVSSRISGFLPLSENKPVDALVTLSCPQVLRYVCKVPCDGLVFHQVLPSVPAALVRLKQLVYEYNVKYKVYVGDKDEEFCPFQSRLHGDKCVLFLCF